jgi:cytoskeletal protein CcmA (bactofilin family)
MACFSELTYAIFVDDELPPEEASRVRAHLNTCNRCRGLVAALRAENQALTEVLANPVPAAAKPLLREFLILVGVVGVVGAGLSWLSGQTAPVNLNWLNPFNAEGRMNALFNFVFFLQSGGTDMLERWAALVGGICVVFAIGGTMLLLPRSRRLFRAGINLALVLLAFVFPGHALEHRTGNNVTVAQTETINDTLVVHAETVEMDGAVNGDLIAQGRLVEVRGTVKGSVFAFAQHVEIDGTVEGSVVSWGQTITVRGKLAHNLYSWSQFLRFEPSAEVGKDVISGGADLNLEGKVDRNATLFAKTSAVRGFVGHDLVFRGGKLDLSPPARVGGDVAAYVRNSRNVHVASGVVIVGKTETHIRHAVSRFSQLHFYVWQAIWLAAAFLVGLVAIWLVPGFFRSVSQGVAQGWRSPLLGFAVLVVTPIAVVLGAITVVGLPLAVLTLLFYGIGLYLAKIFVGAALGQFVLRSDTSSRGQLIGALIVGLVILTIVFQIPFAVGKVIHVVTFCFGLGAFAWHIYRVWRPPLRTQG